MRNLARPVFSQMYQNNHQGLRFVSTVPKLVVAVSLVAGAANVASGHPTTQPARALAVWPYSDVTQAFPAAVMTRPDKVARDRRGAGW